MVLSTVAMDGEILLPPSPNWFHTHSFHSREEDSLIVVASFRTILVYKISKEVALPKILKAFPFIGGKVLTVRLHSSVSHPDYGHTIVASGDKNIVILIDLHDGKEITHHTNHKANTVTGITWGSIGDEDVLVSVGSGGQMVVWQPRHSITRTIHLQGFNNLNVVDSVPNHPDRVIVAAEKDLLLVELKTGSILQHLRGHTYDIYSLSWYPGTGNPLELPIETTHISDKVEPENNTDAIPKEGEKNIDSAESSNWRERSSAPVDNGPFIASSDSGRNVFIWSIAAKRYVTKTNIPHASTGFKRNSKDARGNMKAHHISIGWYKDKLLATTVTGELISLTLCLGGSKISVLHHLHSRVIYNLVILNDIAVTSSHDRFIQGFYLPESTHIFQLPTLGSCANTIAICPHDIKRMAVGLQESAIRILNFGSPVPYQSQIIQNIKGRVISMAWHPHKEGCLLYGSGDGQVGIIDVSQGKLTTFAYFHQKSTYKVEWAPPIPTQNSEITDGWCAYSFGDREIVLRIASDPFSDPIFLKKIIPKEELANYPKDITEFSFSPDYKYLALGSNDGMVKVYRSTDMKLLLTFAVVRKSIQHILWKPPTSSFFPYVLAVGSSEFKIHIFHLDLFLNDEDIEKKDNVVTQASQELCGHTSRVVWLSWSPHKDGVLASASYDQTVQLWDTNTGEKLGNYGGHINRVFRVEFSHSDPDLLFSFADENSLHQWRPSQLSCKTPEESIAKLKDYKSGLKVKVKEGSNQPDEPSSAGGKVSSSSVEGKNFATTKTTTTISHSQTIQSANSSSGTKRPTTKSFFPVLHQVSSRKKSFLLFSILSQIELSTMSPKEEVVEAQTVGNQDNEEGLEDDDDTGGDKTKGNKNEAVTQESKVINNILTKYNCLLEKDTAPPDTKDISYFLDFHGKADKMDHVLETEIGELESREVWPQSSLVHVWQGSLEREIQSAARHKRLNPFLVSAAPQGSRKLWEFACEAYAEQLTEEGDFVTAATYLVFIQKIEEAVTLLVKNRYYKEAVAVAKCRGSNPEVLNKTLEAWSDSVTREGNYDLAAILRMTAGNYEDAARILARRTDPGSLIVAAELYRKADNSEMATATALLALKESIIKNDQPKIESVIAEYPEHKWFQTVNSCHNHILTCIEESKNKSNCNTKYLLRRLNQGSTRNDITVKENIGVTNNQNNEGETRPTCDMNAESNNTQTQISDASAEINDERTINNDTTIQAINEQNGNDSESDHIKCVEKVIEATDDYLPLLTLVIKDWEAKGFTAEQYPELNNKISENFVTQQFPSSVKQLWLLVSVSLSRLLTAQTHKEKSAYLQMMIDHLSHWGKVDQMTHLTHILLPHGQDDTSTLMLSKSELNLPEVKQLQKLYIISDLSLLYQYMKSDPSWLPWQQQQMDNDQQEPNASEEEKLKDSDSQIPSESNKDEDSISSKGEVKSQKDVKMLCIKESKDFMRSYLQDCIINLAEYIPSKQVNKIDSEPCYSNHKEILQEIIQLLGERAAFDDAMVLSLKELINNPSSN